MIILSSITSLLIVSRAGVSGTAEGELQVRGGSQPEMEGYHLSNLRWVYNCSLVFHDHIYKEALHAGQ